MKRLPWSIIISLGLLGFGCGSDNKDSDSCSDELLNQDESDVDCGGICGATCTPGDTCVANSDCTTADCDGTCQPLASCDDTTLNGTETDVDCGGAMCDACADGDMCTVGTDCTSGGCSGDGLCVPTYTVGGTVTGVAGSGLVLQNNGGDNLDVSADGSFVFSTSVPSGDMYEVTVLTGPGTPEQYCNVSWGGGTISADVSGVAVECVTATDNIADAFALAEGVEVRFNTVGATLETDEAICDAGGTVWFSFSATGAGEFVAYGTGSDHDTEIAWSDALTGPLGDCNDDADDSYDAVDAQRTFIAAEQEYVQVGLNGAGYVGTGSIGVTEVLAAADGFAGAGTLEFRSGAATAVTGLDFAGTEGLETDEATACGATTLDSASAWLNFVAPSSGTWMIESKSSNATDLAVYEGSAVDALTLLNCATSDHIAVLVDLTAGDTYRIRVSDPLGTEPVVVRAERSHSPMSSVLVDSDGDTTSTYVGAHSDLAVLGGELAIAYFDGTNGELRFAQRSSGVWTDVLIDADGDGTSTEVGMYPSLAVLANGEPVVAYYDSTNDELRFAERSGGVWSDVLIDADGDGTSTNVGQFASLIVLASGEPAVAYYDVTNQELRIAERSSAVWSDALIDADGDGTSTNVGSYPGLVEFSNGLGVSYIDDTNSELRFARYSANTWTDELVYKDELGDTLLGAGVVLDSNSNPVVAATDSSQGNHVMGWWNGSTWDLDWDYADRHLAELDFGCTAPELLIDSDDLPHLVWTDCNYSGTMAISVRDAAGSWSIRDVTAQHLAPTDPAFGGTVAVWRTSQFGAAWLPDGKLAISFQGDAGTDLWCAEGL